MSAPHSLSPHPGVHLALLAIAFASFHIISPVSDMVLAASNVLYGLFLAGILGYLALGRNLPRQPAARWDYVVLGTIAALALTIVLHIFANPDSAIPDLRYLLILGIGVGIYHRANVESLEKALSVLIWFFLAYGIFSLFVHGLLATGVVDPEIWAAAKLRWLPEKNPIAALASEGGQSYLIFYSMAITRADDVVNFGLFRFVRWTGFFVEPTDVAFVLAPLLLFSIHRAVSSSLIWLAPLAVLGVMFVWAFATSGFVALAMVLILRVLLIPIHHASVTFLRLGIGASFLVALIGLAVSPEAFLSALLGDQNLIQFEYFKNEFLKGIGLYTSPTPFGLGVGANFDHRAYGILSVIVQHGWLPFAVMLFLLSILTIASIWLIRSRHWLIGGAGVTLLTILLKYPDVINLYFILVGMYVLKVWQRHVSPSPGPNLIAGGSP